MKEKREIQKRMHGHLIAALGALEGLDENDRRRALKNIAGLNEIKEEIEEKARSLGYSRACKESIPVCKGACCKWHFPRDLDNVDFFIAVHDLPPERRQQLERKLRDFNDKNYQCPLLREDGCFFSFADRPIVCTIAYPCSMGRSYWEMLQKKREAIKKRRLALARIERRYRNENGILDPPRTLDL